MINCIVCVDDKWGIGKNNNLLFNIKEDMKQFKEKTLNNIVCMGYNTLLSFPNKTPLPNRINVVLAPKEIEEYEGCIVVHTLYEMLQKLKELEKEYAGKSIWVIGGAMFYSSMIDYCDTAYVTKVNAVDKEATAFFPDLDHKINFVLRGQSNLQQTKELNTTYYFLRYENIKKKAM